MIRLKHGVQVLLGGTLVYSAACGGSTGPGDLGGAGITGSTQSFAGALATAGYSSASAGTDGESGSVGIANGGTPDDSVAGALGIAGDGLGGSTSAGGAPGTAGAAAGDSSVGGAVASGGASSCPAAAPTNGNMCTTATAAAESCLYVGASCTCRAPIVIGPRPGGGGAGAAPAAGAGAGAAPGAAAQPTWRCTGSGAACPASAPTTGGMCTNPTGAGAAALDCPYPDGKTCRCTNRRWECTVPRPPACPAKQPTGACTAIQSCTYGTAAMRVRCECDGAAWACDMAGAPAPRCTAKARAALATGDTCTGIGECPVAGAAAATCVCDGKTVTCND